MEINHSNIKKEKEGMFTARSFKKSVFVKLISLIIITSFILTSVPISAYCSSANTMNALRPLAEREAQEIAKALRQDKISKSITAWFKDLRKDDVALVGGKNANLGELMVFLGDMIPDGFAVTVKGYQEHLDNNRVNYNGKDMTLREYILARTAGLNYGDDVARAEAASDIQEAIINGTMSKEVEDFITEFYAKLCELVGEKDADVAVRSSATAEDLPEASFAGQQATFLNVHGIKEVLAATKKCWASLFEQRAMAYRHNQDIAEDKAFLSVAIQLMVDSETSGIMFNRDIENGSPGITINGGPGLGEPWVNGTATPDQYKLVYDVKTGKPTYWMATVGSKLFKLVRVPGGGTQRVDTTPEERKKLCISVGDAEQLGYAAKLIEQHYGRPMDIEWGRDGTNKQLKIVQARPDTVWNDDPLVHAMDYMQVPDDLAQQEKASARVKGYAVSPRAGKGRVRIIRNEPVKDATTGKEDPRATSLALAKELSRVQKGDILVAPVTSPDFVEAMKRSSGVVTNEGGIASHAGIVTRELKIPSVVGTGNATGVLQENQLVTVDSKGGYIAEKELPLVRVTQLNDLRKYPKLKKTKIGFIMSDPDLAMSLWKFGNWEGHGGIGLIRDEHFLISQILVHPQTVIDYDNYYDPNYVPKSWQHDKKWIKEHIIDVDGEAIAKLIKDYSSFKALYLDIKKNGLVKLAKAQAGGQRVLYRTSDFKSNEFKNLKFGPEYEPSEENPMAGNRGVTRVLTPEFMEVFRLDLQAVKEARKIRSNIDVMLPVVRTPEDIAAAAQIMAEEGLFDGEDKPKLAMMMELASDVLMVDEMYQTLVEVAAKYGAKPKMSIGSNDMTQFLLGVDRDSGKMAQYADFWDPAVVKAIEIVIKRAKKYNIETGICGEAPSKDPNFAGLLVEFGINTISVSPESYDTVVKIVGAKEKELEEKPFDPTIKDWEFPSELEIKQLPKVSAERVDASEIIRALGVHPLIAIKMAKGAPLPNVLDDKARAEVARILPGKIEEMLIERFSSAILEKTKVVDANTPIIFTTDTNQSTVYKKLLGGNLFETNDENPYLALCGLVRVVDPEWEDLFRWQLRGLKRARELSGRKNIGISLDLAINTKSVRRALEIMKEKDIDLVPGQDGLMVGMEISRGGHFLILKQYLDLGLNFISENFQRFTEYVLPEDPGNPFLHIPMDRKQRQFINGQKIWTNIAAERKVPILQFDSGLLTPWEKSLKYGLGGGSQDADAGNLPRVEIATDTSINGDGHNPLPSQVFPPAADINIAPSGLNKDGQHKRDKIVYNGTSLRYGNFVNVVKESKDQGNVIMGANAILENGGMTALKMLKGTSYNVVIWAQNEAMLEKLQAMGIEEVTKTLKSEERPEDLKYLLGMSRKNGIPTTLILSPLDRKGIDLGEIQKLGVQILNLETPQAKEAARINSMPLVIARAIAGIAKDDRIIKEFKELTKAYGESGKISAENLALVNDLTAQISTMPLVAVNQEIADDAEIYKTTNEGSGGKV